MTDEQKQEWEHLYDTLMDKPRKVFEIFSNYFGERRVDFQGFCSKEHFCNSKERFGNTIEDISILTEEDIFILIWFPEVKVTNEHDKFIYIQDLYIKVKVDTKGYLIGKFALNRATYTLDQIRAGYLHSHALINVGRGDTTIFSPPCTGRGPINSTIAHLNREFDEGLWQLYCSELEDFIQVESLEGGPYRKLEEVNANTNNSKIPHFDYISIGSYKIYHDSGKSIVINSLITDFTRYLLKSKSLPIEYSNDTYCIGMSPLQATIFISNKFIEWFNFDDNPYRRQKSLDILLRDKILIEAVINESTICPVNTSSSDFLNPRKYEGAPICTFKDKYIKLHIIENNQNDANSILLLNHYIINDIVSAICKVINFRYGRKESEKKFKLDRQTLYI